MKNKLIALTGMLFLGALSGCAGTPPANLGVTNGQINPCPSSPNCVSSQTTPEDERHFIAPIAYTGKKQEAFSYLLLAIQAIERTKITECTEGYLRVEFRSAHLGFVDDVEFYFPEEPLIHVRSASRKGYSDMGVNRKRIERIRVLLAETVKGIEQ